MSEIEDTRKAALNEAEKGPIIQVKITDETVVVNEPIAMTVRFFSRSSENLLNLVPLDLSFPVVEMVGEPGPGESRVTYLQKQQRGVFVCRLVPTVPGPHAYKVKESAETDIGELVEVEVLPEEADSRLKEFFRKLMPAKLQP